MPTKQILGYSVMTIALAGCTNKKTESGDDHEGSRI